MLLTETRAMLQTSAIGVGRAWPHLVYHLLTRRRFQHQRQCQPHCSHTGPLQRHTNARCLSPHLICHRPYPLSIPPFAGPRHPHLRATYRHHRPRPLFASDGTGEGWHIREAYPYTRARSINLKIVAKYAMCTSRRNHLRNVRRVVLLHLILRPIQCVVLARRIGTTARIKKQESSRIT